MTDALWVLKNDNGIWYKPDKMPYVTDSFAEATFIRQICAPEFEVTLVKLVSNPLSTAPLWSQRDPRWAGEKMGDGPTTIAQYGCLITALSMGFTAVLGQGITPLDFNAAIKAAGGYTGENRNRLIWSKVPVAYPEFKLDLLVNCVTAPAPIAKIAQAVDRADVVAVKIDFKLTTQDVDQHWILLTGVDEARPIFEVHDPWPWPGDQVIQSLPPAYCKQGWDAGRAIFGVVSYTRTNQLLREGLD